MFVSLNVAININIRIKNQGVKQCVELSIVHSSLFVKMNLAIVYQ